MPTEPPLLFVPVGSNPARLFGMDARVRACRLAANAGFECAETVEPGRGTLIGSLHYAWDPAWLKAIAARPGSVLTLGGKPVLAHVPVGGPAPGPVAEAMAGPMAKGDLAVLARLEQIAAETFELSYAELRKRERPFVMPLDPADPEAVERAAYDASYKGVTDVLTLYLWRKPAFHLTRWAAEAGLSPNMVTAVGAVLCLLAFWLFWEGQYWLGTASGFAFMVLDTVDGKLARCTGTSSKWGNVFDHGIDLIHPPFWWWAWIHGLAAYGRPLEPIYATMLLWVIVGGYVAQRLIEGIFMRRFGGMHIHVWRPIDSQFRLVTARRNPNMVILVAALLFARPDAGIKLVALWTIVSLIFHAVRLAQATVQAEQGKPVEILAGMSGWTALVLAGSRPGLDPFAQRHGTDLKALIPVSGEPMVRRPVTALLSSERFGAVRVLTQQVSRIAEVLPADPRLTVEPSADTIAATLEAVCNDPATQWPVLLTTADHALLDQGMIDDFCGRAGDADIAIAVVERQALLRRLPATRRTWIRFRGGAYSGANLFMLRSPDVRPAIALWRSVEQDRKTGWRLLMPMGPSLFLGAALRWLTLDQALRRIGSKLNLAIRAVEMADPLAAVDVDKPGDHRLVEAILAGRK